MENVSTIKQNPKPQLRYLIGWLLGYLHPYRTSFAVFIGVSLLQILIGLLVPWSMKVLVDNVLGNELLPAWLSPLTEFFSLHDKFSLLIAVCLAGLFIGLTGGIVSVVFTQLQVGIGQKTVLDLQRDLFEHLQKLSLSYHQKTGTGDAIYRLTSETFCVYSIILSGIIPLLISFLTLLLMFSILLRLEWSLALISLAVIPPLFLVINRYSWHLSEKNKQVKAMESQIYNLVHEVFSSIKLVKAFSREQYEQQNFFRQGTHTFRARLEVTYQESLFSFAVNALTLVGTAAVLGVGSWHVLRGDLTVGDLLIVVAYLGAVYAPLSAISKTIGSLQGALTSARRVYETLNLEPEIKDVPEAVKAQNLRGHIKFENVSFGYDNTRPILSDINFEIEVGKKMAVVGLTGVGKSTLVSLIPRFYDPTLGRVTIDGIDVSKMQLKSLRESISIVTQEPILFSSSAEENIRYGKLNATREEIIAAAQAAQAHDFIENLSEGYATLLGESGNQLSGGERQRISIARALLKDAPVLILDEPTSSLDSRSESLIFTALQHLMKNRTTIVIAHRLSTIINADKIIVLDKGKIAVEGKHKELLETNELYRELYERLLQGFALKTRDAIDANESRWQHADEPANDILLSKS
ncbi:MAG: ABC transporter ATP-binding protein/permease [Acidobacteriota bacterium]|nr:ABC transporter ATP-binding protein/permease [Acidobacteriota bacterium]